MSGLTDHALGRAIPSSLRRVRNFISALTVLAVALSAASPAQTPDIRFHRLSIADGLSQSIVNSIIQDQRGFLWFATEDGLNRFDGYEFILIRNEPDNPNSLSHNQINVLYEDRSGNIWVGTFNGGLTRYTPVTRMFTRYRHDAADPTSLSNDIVTSILEDEEGNLWVGTVNGLNRLPKDSAYGSGGFERFYHDAASPSSISNNTIWSILQGRTGTLWFGTEGGLNKLIPTVNGPRFAHYKHDPRYRSSLSNDTVRALLEDRSGSLWVGTARGLNMLPTESSPPGSNRSRPGFRRYLHEPGNPSSLSNNDIYALLEDRNGVLWVGTDGGGLDRYIRSTQNFERFTNDPRDLNSLSYNQIRSLYEDRSGNIWVGTYGGSLSKMDAGRKQFVHYQPDPDNPNSLNEAIVWAIYQDRDGILWLGTHGGGLNRLDRKRNIFTHYVSDSRNQSTLSSNIVRNIAEDRFGTLWIGTHGGGICSFDRRTQRFTRFRHDPANPKSLSDDDIRWVFEDRKGTLWIGTQGGGINRLIRGRDGRTPAGFAHYRHDPTDSNSVSSDFIRVIFQDRKGTFWVATMGGGLNKFDCAAGTFTHYRADPKNPNSLSNDYVMSIYEDRSGYLWLGTWGGGLNRFDRKTGQFKRYGEKDGLPSPAIYATLEDEDGNLWMSTNNGISKFNPRTETFRNYGVSDGLQSKEFNGNSFFHSPSGEMFFGGINGFNSFFPADIRDNAFVPPIVITSFKKLNEEVEFDRPISDVDKIMLSHEDYVFTFQFAALDFTAPEKNLYAYKMEGLDDNWVYTDAQNRTAHYTTLPAGSYVFRVKGSNNDGVWNEEGTAIRITIKPPFWNSWWFVLMSIAVVGGLAFVLYQRRLKNIRMKTELQAAHDAQMSIMPHSDPQFEGFDVSGICLPANEVGGDFFDYLWLDGDRSRFGIVVGDVSGKAMSAAMTAVLTSGIINAEAQRTPDISEIVKRANQILHSKTDRKMFTALCLIGIEVSTKRLSFTNAGLAKPLLKSEGTVTALEARGPTQPIGALPEVSFEEKKARLKKGDILVLVTDGVQEARTHSKDQYGDERLVRLLGTLPTSSMSAQAIRDAIIADVKAFAGTAPQHDDMTVLVLRAL